MPRVTIDGTVVRCAQGATVLAAARSAGITVPALCHDERIAPTGACRICLVEVDGASRPVPACATAVQDGWVIRTQSPSLPAARRVILELLADRHPADLPPGAADKPFHQLLQAEGIAPASRRSSTDVDDSHPYIHVDMARCIDCYRCLRICAELQGQDVWHLHDRGIEVSIRPDGKTLAESSCVACGACVDTCPSGALEDRSVIVHGSATEWTRSVCPYCGVGCELEYGTREGRIVASRPVIDAPVNRGHACVKGRYAYEFVHAADRLAGPRLRASDGSWRDASWDEAIGEVAGRLRAVIDRYGPDAVAVLGSARATNEENFLVQKFARLAVGTNNVDCCARVCHAPSAAALKFVLGTGAATNSFDDIEEARTILVCGANATENHPVIGARIRQAARRGARLIVIDPRRIELAREPRALHLAPAPGTNVPLLLAIAQALIVEGRAATEFIEAQTTGFEAYRDSLAEWTPERAAAICGVPAEAIRQAARWYADGPSMSFHGLGVTEHVQGTDGVIALVNLALITGNLGKRGAGVNPLRGQNNVQGAALMGCDPGALAGGVPIEEGRAAHEAAWGRPLPATPGLKLLDMIDGAVAGTIKAMVVFGYDILLTNPNACRTRRALEALDLLVVVDLFATETSMLAHAVLPARSSFEKDGTFMNAERRVQRVRAVVPPIGDALSDGEIVCRLAAAMGHRASFIYDGPSSVWNEVGRLWPAVRGITYSRITREGLQWPCPSADHPGTPILFDRGLGERRRLHPLTFQPTPERTSAAYPLLLSTGRTLYQFNAGTMTGRTPNRLLRGEDLLEISAADASMLKIAAGDRVRVVSRHGEASLRIAIADTISPGHLFATFHTPEVFLNRVTSDVRDRVGTPEYKMTAVRLERIAATGGCLRP